MLTAGEQEMLRIDSEATMVARCTILRPTTSSPRPGYDTETFGAYLSDVPCYLYNVRTTERTTIDRSVVATASRLILPRETDVTSGDRVGAVTLYGETLLSNADGIEIRVTPNPAHLVIDLIGVS